MSRLVKCILENCESEFNDNNCIIKLDPEKDLCFGIKFTPAANCKSGR